jgi:hypothetical protein
MAGCGVIAFVLVLLTEPKRLFAPLDPNGPPEQAGSLAH